jgi:hypothetical protein
MITFIFGLLVGWMLTIAGVAAFILCQPELKDLEVENIYVRGRIIERGAAREEAMRLFRSCKPIVEDLRYTRFGKSMWEMIRKLGEDFCGDEWSEEVLPLAEEAGLCRRVKYNPEIHGEIEAEPGWEIWWWGDDILSQNKVIGNEKET